MNNPNSLRLYAAFDDVIKAAWRNSTAVQAGAHSEPNHVARFVHGVPAGMAAAIKQLPGVSLVEVQGTFCHASPYAFWLSGINYRKKELGDLLVAVEITEFGFLKSSKALIVQTKMGSIDARDWDTPITLTVDEFQRELYADLAPFCLELPGRPTRDTVKASKLNLQDFMTNAGGPPFPRPYDLSAFQPTVPVGLVYAAIDRNRSRKQHSAGPWIVESGRPMCAGKTATFDTPFALALASMVGDKDSHYGVQSHLRLSGSPDWHRLIGDLRNWADERALDLTDGTHQVQLEQGASRDGVFHNVQRMLSVSQVFAEHGRLLGVSSWAGCATTIEGNMRLKREKLRQLYATRRITQQGNPPSGWDPIVDYEEPGGFGVLLIQIELDPRSRTRFHPADRHY